MKVALPTIDKINPKLNKDPQSQNDCQNKPYNYFTTRIPKSHIKTVFKNIKDDRFRFFIKFSLLRRYDGECEIIYVELPQIPKQLIVYRRPSIRMKSPEKLILKYKDLPHIPLFEGEENLNALSLECNLISKIDRLISLNSLTYLNLYFNHIKDIENLQSLTHLRVLLLGKNHIEKIKNLTALTEIEILDIHSNKIKIIENLTHLRKLRILNIANNQITSLSELIINKALEDLNARKNIISELPDLTNQWEKMMKINLGKNLIARTEWLVELKKLKNLVDISLEDNPVCALNKECIGILKGIMKVNLNMTVNVIKGNSIMMNSTGGLRFGLGLGLGLGMSNNIGKNMLNTSVQKINDKTRCTSPINTSLKSLQLTSQLKQFQRIVSSSNTPHNAINAGINIVKLGQLSRNNLISNTPTNSQSIISSQQQTPTISTAFESKWLTEFQLIINNGFNGYNLKRIKDIYITNGHIEYDIMTNATTVICYGDCLKNLLHSNNTYYHATTLQFNYFHYDFIMRKKNIEKLKEFKNLTHLSLKDNNIHCFYQLIKLEELPQLKNVTIRNNEVCTSGLLKYFLLYRKQNIKEFNEEEISEKDLDVAKEAFELFDRCISVMDMKEKEKEIRLEKEKKEEGNNGFKKDGNEKEKVIDEMNKRNDCTKYDLFSYVRNNLDVALQEIMIEYSQSFE